MDKESEESCVGVKTNPNTEYTLHLVQEINKTQNSSHRQTNVNDLFQVDKIICLAQFHAFLFLSLTMLYQAEMMSFSSLSWRARLFS